jgi:hypothetical protein
VIIRVCPFLKSVLPKVFYISSDFSNCRVTVLMVLSLDRAHGLLALPDRGLRSPQNRRGYVQDRELGGCPHPAGGSGLTGRSNGQIGGWLFLLLVDLLIR